MSQLALQQQKQSQSQSQSQNQNQNEDRNGNQGKRLNMDRRTESPSDSRLHSSPNRSPNQIQDSPTIGRAFVSFFDAEETDDDSDNVNVTTLSPPPPPPLSITVTGPNIWTRNRLSRFTAFLPFLAIPYSSTQSNPILFCPILSNRALDHAPLLSHAQAQAQALALHRKSEVEAPALTTNLHPTQISTETSSQSFAREHRSIAALKREPESFDISFAGSRLVPRQ
ncbi:hypothetical protein TruAng_002212 [Truncatella angustata]|nr:hypothetical protein TruAng_002212 [Truncatella angustata]